MGILTPNMPPFSPMGNYSPYGMQTMMPQTGFPAAPMSPYPNIGGAGLPYATNMMLPNAFPSADVKPTYGPMPMSGLQGQQGQDSASFSHAPRPRPMTGSASDDSSWSESLNKTETAASTPGARTVKRLEQPLIRFLDENPDIREKIDNINLDTMTDNITSTTSKSRVSLHNSFKRIPNWVTDRMINQLDPHMQDSARQLLAWIRKPPSPQEMAAIRDAEKSNGRQAQKQDGPSRKRPAANDENFDPFSAINWK